jgi:hypothetical protein
MDRVPLVMTQIDAGAKFVGEFQKYLPVQSAFWLEESDGGEWSHYIVSDQITDDNFDVAYGEVLRIAYDTPDCWFDPFQVKLIGHDNPLAKAAAEIRRRFAGRTPTRFNGEAFGGMPVEAVYMYPSPIPAPA